MYTIMFWVFIFFILWVGWLCLYGFCKFLGDVFGTNEEKQIEPRRKKLTEREKAEIARARYEFAMNSAQICNTLRNNQRFAPPNPLVEAMRYARENGINVEVVEKSERVIKIYGSATNTAARPTGGNIATYFPATGNARFNRS